MDSAMSLPVFIGSTVALFVLLIILLYFQFTKRSGYLLLSIIVILVIVDSIIFYLGYYEDPGVKIVDGVDNEYIYITFGVVSAVVLLLAIFGGRKDGVMTKQEYRTSMPVHVMSKLSEQELLMPGKKEPVPGKSEFE